MGRSANIPDAIKVQIINDYEQTGATAKELGIKYGVKESYAKRMTDIALVNIKSRVRMENIIQSSAHDYNPELELG